MRPDVLVTAASRRVGLVRALQAAQARLTPRGRVIEAEGAARLVEHAERIGVSLRLGMGLLPRGRDLGLPIVQTGGNGRQPSGG